MRKNIYTIVLLALISCASNANAQSFNEMLKGGFGDYVFYPILNYVYSKGYPIGIQAGPLRLGFAAGEVKYWQSPEEYRVPKWSAHSTLMVGLSLVGPLGVNLGIDAGANVAERYRIDPLNPNNQFHDRLAYFSLAPMVGIDFWWINAFVGYEWVFKFKDIQGLVYGIGLTIPIPIEN